MTSILDGTTYWVGAIADPIDLEQIGIGRLHNEDLENALCELARYEKLRLGEGTVRRYDPT